MTLLIRWTAFIFVLTALIMSILLIAATIGDWCGESDDDDVWLSAERRRWR